jgi:hypothetical protein
MNGANTKGAKARRANRAPHWPIRNRLVVMASMLDRLFSVDPPTAPFVVALFAVARLRQPPLRRQHPPLAAAVGTRR